VIAVDIGGTYLRTGIVRGNKLFNYVKSKTPKTKKAVLNLFVSEISKQITPNVKGIGISCAGVVDKGILKCAPNLPINGVNIKKFLQLKFNKKIIIENDANCVAIAESKIGQGKTKKNFIVLALGTGIGGGIIINGKLYKGAGFAGEIGHIILDKGKDFEYYASGKAIQSLSLKHFHKKLAIQELIKQKDTKSEKILNEISMYLGQGIASLISIFDPEVVILAGGLRESGNEFLNMIKKQAYKYNFIPRKTPILFSKIDHAGTLGAGLLFN